MLTKSDFLTFLEAPMHLWAKKHSDTAHKPISTYSQHLMKQGYEVQKLARMFLEQKVASQYPDANLMFEVTLTDGPYEARIDALVHDNVYDTYDLYEIKSSSSIHKEHEYDVTFQYLIGREQLNVHKIYLVRVNKDFVKDGEIDIEAFFVVDDMMEVVAAREDEVLKAREAALPIAEQPEKPAGGHCYKPADCPYPEVCHPDLPPQPIYDLYRGIRKQYDTLTSNGIYSLADIGDGIRLSSMQALQLESLHSNAPVIDVPAIKK